MTGVQTCALPIYVSLQLLTEKDADALKVVRHSAAHVMATAVLELYPETKLGHGPATDAGFFYDFYRPTPFTPEDLKAIEAKMAEVVARNEPFVREWEPRDQSLERFKKSNDFMKAHFVERFTKPPTVSIHGTIANVWGEYEFLREGKFAHCGVDSFNLLRTVDGWKVAAIFDTEESVGCPTRL